MDQNLKAIGTSFLVSVIIICFIGLNNNGALAYKCCKATCCPASLTHGSNNEDIAVYSNETERIKLLRSAIILHVDDKSTTRNKRDSSKKDDKKDDDKKHSTTSSTTTTTSSPSTTTTASTTTTTTTKTTIRTPEMRPLRITYIYEGRECNPKCSESNVKFTNCDREYDDCNPRKSLEHCANWWRNCQHRLRPLVSGEMNEEFGSRDYNRHNHDDDLYYRHHHRSWRRGWRRRHGNLIEILD